MVPQRQQQQGHMRVGANFVIIRGSQEAKPVSCFRDLRIEPERGVLSNPMPMREFEYQLCDVFTNKPFEGNPLAVFLDAAALSDREMQAIAREMNLSETTFVLRRDAAVERDRGIRVRIFTTQEELPFAGHPTLGTATTIRRIFPEFAGANRIVLDLNGGQVPV